MKATLAEYLIFYKLMVFETSIIFLESTITIKSITGIFDFQILIMTVQVLFLNVFSEKDPYLNAVELLITIFILLKTNFVH